MSDVLTGAAADAYLSAWMESARGRKPLNAARVRRDALRASSSKAALHRLRLASARVAVKTGARAAACRPRGRTARHAVKARRSACTAPGRHGSPSRPRPAHALTGGSACL